MVFHSTIATKFLVISDTHNFEIGDATEDSQLSQLPTLKSDVLLHCGDLTQVGGVSSFKKALKMLRSIDAELKLVIPGNHDLELDKQYWEAQCDDEGASSADVEDHDLAVKAMTGPLAGEAGVLLLNEGAHSFTLQSGAKFTIYVSPYTPAFGDWAFAYKPHEDRFNKPHQVFADNITSIATNPIPAGIDIVMTHGPPKGILDWCPQQGHVGCENILQAIRRVKPMMHCFGHVHESNGMRAIDWDKSATADIPAQRNETVYTPFQENQIENPYPQPFRWNGARGNQTLAVNAAIMTGDNKPEQAPWLISLDLPCTR
ncbi:hypothetical protein MMC20_002433 [Loxospora ochrophaea]|nr:hypothetical protein [Loxospora ochrophaea]